jgi:hypothetical protein
MNPNTFKEYISNGLDYDALLAWCQYFHPRELINYHEDKIIPILSLNKNKHVIHGDGLTRRIWSR